MGSALRAHSPSLNETKGTSKADNSKYQRMKAQAKKVLEHLSALSVPEETLHLHEAAERAQASVFKLASDSFHGGLKGLYSQYDVDRRGRIGYDDFCNSLLLSNAGVNRTDARRLASEMDKQKTGELDYTCILDALKEVEQTSRDQLLGAAAKKAAPPSSGGSDDAVVLAAAEAPRASAANADAKRSSSPTETRRVKFFPSADADATESKGEDEERWMQRVITAEKHPVALSASATLLNAPSLSSSSSSSSSEATNNTPPPPPPDSTSQPLVTFESLHNPAFVHVAVAPPAPPAPPADPAAPQAPAARAPSSEPLSSSKFQASLSSMLLPPQSQQELSHTSRGRGQFSGAVLIDHIAHAEGALGPSVSTQRRILGPGKVHDHNIESDEFRDLVRDGTIQGRRASLSPYWTDMHPAPGSAASAGGGTRRPLVRTSRRMRSTSAPAQLSPKAKRQGTHYSYFYGNANDSVAEAMGQRAEGAASNEHSESEEADVDADVPDRVGASSSSSRLPSDETKAAESDTYESSKEIDSRLRENALLIQVGGRFNYLRHILRQGDDARSGFVNYGEFKTAMGKAGVRLSDTQARSLYDEHSEAVQHTSVIGHPDGKALSISSFVDNMHELAQRPEKSALPGHNPEESKQTEDRRIAKKVLHSLKRIADPMSVFKGLDVTKKGWIRPEQLRSGLSSIGASLTEFEFNQLLERIDTNKDDKIDIREFDAMLHETVATESKTQLATQAAIATNRRYNNTYRHNFALNHENETEYDRFLDSSNAQKDRKTWTHVQYALQGKPDKVLGAFISSSGAPGGDKGFMSGFTGAAADPEKFHTQDSSSLRRVKVDSLGEALANCGVLLGAEDRQLLQSKLAASHVVASDGSVSLDDFCTVANLQVKYSSTGQSTRVGLSQPWETHDDGGIFSSVAASHHGSDTVASSFFRRGEDGNIWVRGNRRRKNPDALHPDLHEAPHKWLEMKHSATGDLWPTTPNGSTFLRGQLDAPHKIGSRSVASPKAKSMRRMSSSTYKNDSSFIEHMGDFDRYEQGEK